MHLIIIKPGEQEGDPQQLEIRATHDDNSHAIADHLATGNPIAIERDGQVTHHEMKHIQVSTFTDHDLGILGQALKQYFILLESSKHNDPNQIDKATLNEMPQVKREMIFKKRGGTPSSVPKNNLPDNAIKSVLGSLVAKKTTEIRKKEKLQEEADIKKEAINAQEERLEINRTDQIRTEIDKSFLDSPHIKKNPPEAT